MEDKTVNRGVLFTDKESRIFKSGNINVNGDKKYFLVSEQKGKDGKSSYPLYLQVGWLNINTKKTEDKQPDVLGNFEYNTFDFKVAGWKQEKQRDDGSINKYLSVSVQFDKKESEKNDGFNETEKKIEENITEFDDEVPF